MLEVRPIIRALCTMLEPIMPAAPTITSFSLVKKAIFFGIYVSEMNVHSVECVFCAVTQSKGSHSLFNSPHGKALFFASMEKKSTTFFCFLPRGFAGVHEFE